MAKLSTADELQRLVKQLRQEKQDHERAIVAIDQIFASLGLAVAAPAAKRGRPGRKPAAAAPAAAKTRGGRRRKRGVFPQTAEESILEFVKSHGNPTTREINDHWQSEGRKGKADNTLTKLVKARRLKRQEMPGERGSRYTA